MSAVVLLMLASNTVITVVYLKFYVMQLPAIGLPLDSDHPELIKMVQVLYLYDTGMSWLIRLNVGVFP